MNDDHYDNPVTAARRKLLKRAEAGELHSVAMRLFRPDGSFEDVAFGGSEEEQNAALAKLRKADMQ